MSTTGVFSLPSVSDPHHHQWDFVCVRRRIALFCPLLLVLSIHVFSRCLWLYWTAPSTISWGPSSGTCKLHPVCNNVVYHNRLLHLQPIFDWNVKMLFLYLSAEYATKSNVSLLINAHKCVLSTVLTCVCWYTFVFRHLTRWSYGTGSLREVRAPTLNWKIWNPNTSSSMMEMAWGTVIHLFMIIYESLF